MRIVILSTETPHHTYFINHIAAEFGVSAVFYETKPVKFTYDTSSPFGREEAEFEKNNFFKDVPDKVTSSIPTYKVNSVNTPEFKKIAGGLAPDIGLVFGCGRIDQSVFPLFKKGLINVHRGIAIKYRGLDSDLWAIYNDDFGNIGVTLHYVDIALDTGDALAVRHITYSPSDKIWHLRYKTTMMATDMMIDAIKGLLGGEDKRTKQPALGKYYSAMPLAAKVLCKEKFEKYIAGI